MQNKDLLHSFQYLHDFLLDHLRRRLWLSRAVEILDCTVDLFCSPALVWVWNLFCLIGCHQPFTLLPGALVPQNTSSDGWIRSAAVLRVPFLLQVNEASPPQ